MKTILNLGEFQHVGVAVAAAGVLEVHEIIVHRDNAPILFQFRQRAWNGAREVNHKFIGAVVHACLPSTGPSLAGVGGAKAAICAEFESVACVVGRFVLFVKKVGDFPSACGRSRIVAAVGIIVVAFCAGSECGKEKERKSGERDFWILHNSRFCVKRMMAQRTLSPVYAKNEPL